MAVAHPHPVISRLFDIRNIIAALLGIYGILLTIAGVAPGVLRHRDVTPATPDRTNMYAGDDANLWVGLILLAIALLFAGWAAIRPLGDNRADTPDGE